MSEARFERTEGVRGHTGEANTPIYVDIGALYPNGYTTETILSYNEGRQDGITIETFSGEHSNEHLECFRRDGKRQGIGMLYRGDELIMKMTFVDDVLEGWGLIYANQQLEDAVYWKCGVVIREKEVRCEDGLFVLEERDLGGQLVYKGGYDCRTYQREGCGELYKDGQISAVGIFENDRLKTIQKSFDGVVMTEYSADGLITYKGGYAMFSYLRYPREGYGQEFDHATLIYEGSFINGLRSGYGVSYFDNGVASFRGQWLNNKPSEGQFLTKDKLDQWVSFDGCFEYTAKTAYALEMLSQAVTTIHIGDNCCNDRSCTEIVFTELDHLQEINIGSNSCRNVVFFVISGLPALESLRVGNDSFTLCNHTDNKPWDGTNKERIMRESRSFTISACPMLQQVCVGIGSFSDYLFFSMESVASLQSLIIGDANNSIDQLIATFSFFHCAEFLLKGVCCQGL